MTSFFSFLCSLFFCLGISALLPQHALSIENSVEESHSDIRRRVSKEDLQEYYDYIEQFSSDNSTIVAGSNAKAYPWFVHFASKVCGGTLISPNRVLTSATCLQSTGVPSLVRVGATTSRNGILVPVGCAKTHPDYAFESGAILADVAVLKLATSVEGVDPVLLNTDLTYPTNKGQALTALGLGYTNRNGGLANHLQQLELDYIALSECQSRFQSTDIIRSGRHLCALTKKKGLCTGDSGGPLVDRIAGSVRQIGIASFTYGECGVQGIPDVFASVAFYYGWIQTQITDNTCDGSQTPVPTTLMPTVSQAPSSSFSPSQSASPSLAPSDSSRPSESASPTWAPSVSNSPTTAETTTLAPTTELEIDLEKYSNIAVQVFNTVADAVGGLLEIKGGILQRKRDWFQNNIKNNNGNG